MATATGEQMLRPCLAALQEGRPEWRVKQGYCIGVLDALGVLALMDHSRLICPPPHSNTPQAVYIVEKWMKDHPQHLNEPFLTLAIAALMDAFPCHHDDDDGGQK